MGFMLVVSGAWQGGDVGRSNVSLAGLDTG